MKTVIIDNYDSFTFNLFQLIAQCGGNPIVIKNNQTNLEGILKLGPTHLVISPGPGTVLKAEDFGVNMEVIQKLYKNFPILGVCLGHQGIAKAFGANIKNAPTIMHGKISTIEHTKSGIFENIDSPITAMRYHSLCIDPETIPTELKITALSREDQSIMAIEHRQYPLFGIQFHPESFLTPTGEKIINNFLCYKKPSSTV